jgi:uncharacterized protein YkwD
MILPPIRDVPLLIAILCLSLIGPLQAASATDDYDYDQVARDETQMAATILALHNAERTRIGQAALVWDGKLARDAQIYAQTLADKDIFEHADQPNGDDAQGENLWMGSKAAFGWEDMVGMWQAEGKNAKSGIFPNVAITGDWSDVGHYTQIIWPDTKQLGCGIAFNRTDEYLVCRYYPAGNVMGQFIKVKKGK